jgi:hypothetical protein
VQRKRRPDDLPTIEPARRKFWLTETALQMKLWANADDLQRTAEHLKRLGIRETPNCECDNEEETS